MRPESGGHRVLLDYFVEALPMKANDISEPGALPQILSWNFRLGGM